MTRQLARDQILNAARRQFPEGDVQHWWLPRTGAGVRTTISDDVVWLAHATARYLRVTGDAAILKEQLPFIDGQALGEGEHDAFFTPEISKKTAIALRTLRAGARPCHQAQQSRRPAADPWRRLERRHEPCRRARQGRERVAGLVPAEDAGRLRRRRQERGRHQACAGLGKACRGAEAGAGKHGMGRRMVSARQLR